MKRLYFCKSTFVWLVVFQFSKSESWLPVKNMSKTTIQSFFAPGGSSAVLENLYGINYGVRPFLSQRQPPIKISPALVKMCFILMLSYKTQMKQITDWGSFLLLGPRMHNHSPNHFSSLHSLILGFQRWVLSYPGTFNMANSYGMQTSRNFTKHGKKEK